MANYGEALKELKRTAFRLSETEGAAEIGCFLPIRKYGNSRAYGEFSSLSEWLTDVAQTLGDFLSSDEGEEIETWDA